MISEVLAARMTKLITARARKNKRTARMLANARKDHSIPLNKNKTTHVAKKKLINDLTFRMPQHLPPSGIPSTLTPVRSPALQQRTAYGIFSLFAISGIFYYKTSFIVEDTAYCKKRKNAV